MGSLKLFILLTAPSTLLLAKGPSRGDSARRSPHPPSDVNIHATLNRLLGEPRRIPLWTSTLRQQIVFCGSCDRPESPKDRIWLYLKASDQPRMVALGESLWLDFDPGPDTLRPRWAGQGDGQLRAEVVGIHGDRVTLQVAKKSDLSAFFPIELHLDRSPREKSWEIGSHLVDSRLLMKMEARWFGPDQLLTELLGASESAQHLQFGFGSRAYSMPLEMGGILHWEEGRWHRGLAMDCPVLKLDSSDAGKLNFVAWDGQGFRRAEVHLTKLFSPGDLSAISNQIKFKGLRGPKRAQLTLGAQTLIARQGDWLVKRQEGWALLSTPESRRNWLLSGVSGEVIVVQAIERRKGRPRLIAKIYNATHVESVTAEFALAQPLSSAPNPIPHH